MKTPFKTNIALSPIGYWPYGVRPTAKERLKRKDKMRGKSERAFSKKIFLFAGQKLKKQLFSWAESE